MNKFAVVAGVAVLAGGVAAVGILHNDNVNVRREIALLRTEVQLSARARQQSERAASAGAPVAVVEREGAALDGREFAQLREEIAALRKSTQEITRFAQAAQAAKALEKSSESVATNLVPAGALKNAGKATPEASTETALWAAVGGDVDALAGTLMFTASARAKADEWFAGLSAGTKQQYGSPEKVIALMIAKDAEALSGMQVLGRQEIGPDNVGVRVRIASIDGKTKDDTLLMHRSADGWKMVLPDAAVEKFARQISRGK